MNLDSYTYFFENITFQVLLLIVSGLLVAFIGAYLFLKHERNRWHYLLLFLGVCLVSSGFALIPNYLNQWDEQFHALVAKNMMKNPLKPYLLGSQFEYDFKSWDKNHIWLHKQPLFLWQIAASFKLFGINLFALRLPSILLHALTSMLVLSIAKRFLTSFLAILATFLFAFSAFQLSLVSGVQGMDHNDIAFLFYCTLSYWSWLKYNETKEFKYVLLIGFSSGGAILCKWLVGLVVFAGWGTVIVLTQLKELKQWKNLVWALLIAISVFLPWQLYCYFVYPVEFSYEMKYNSLHFSKVLEGHAGDNYFHFDAMKSIYGNGSLISILIWIGITIMVVKGFVFRSGKYLFAVTIFCAIYIFFSIAKTKLEAYTLVASPFGFIALMIIFQVLYEYAKKKQWKQNFKVPAIASIVILFIALSFHFQIKTVVEQNQFKQNEDYSRMREKKTKFVLSSINKGNSDFYFIKDSKEMKIFINASFYTDAEIYPYFPECEKLGKVIDLDEMEMFSNQVSK